MRLRPSMFFKQPQRKATTVRKAIVIFSGFTQQWDEETGSDTLYKRLMPYAEFGSHDELVLIFKREWHDWEELAKWLNLNNVSECFVCGYSWGAGHGLVKFAKTFSGAISCVLCDPVFRSRWPWMRWKAIRRKQNTITYPSNVTVKKVFYQTMDEPGNDLVKDVAHRTRLSVPHTQIDSHPAYHEAAEKYLKEFLQRN